MKWLIGLENYVADDVTVQNGQTELVTLVIPLCAGKWMFGYGQNGDIRKLLMTYCFSLDIVSSM